MEEFLIDSPHSPSESVPTEMNAAALQIHSLQHNNTKRSRTSTHKVRTGCITCKRRRVKCDETKPHCNNCLKTRGHCEGYVAKPRKNAPVHDQLRWDSRQIVHEAAPRIQLQIDSDSIGSRDAAATLYFQEFVGLAQGPWINAVSNNDLWEVTLPQLARNNNVLRYAAMAIGALSMWHRQSRYESLRSVTIPAAPIAEEDTHYFRAVAYYCHSMKLLSQKASPQDAVFLSVLLLFFESLRGNTQAALDHVNHGLTLLFALLTDKNTHYHVANLAPNPKPLLSAVADIFTHLVMQIRTVLRGRVGQGPSLPNLLKELRNKQQTMESFMILLSRLPRSSAVTDQIPTVFRSLDEFEEYWVTSRRRQTMMASIMGEIIQTSGAIGLNDEQVIDHFYFEVLGNPRIREFCAESRKAMQALDAAFLPLFNRIIMSDAKSPEYLRAIHLRLQCIAGYVMEDPTQCLDVEVLASRTPFFREYLFLAGIALRIAKREITNPAHQLSLQSGLAWHLLIVALFCREPLTRDEAVRILRDYPGQDGLWNTHCLYVLALKNRDIERINAVDGTPVQQWRRLWRREFVFEDCGDRIVLRYLDKDQQTGEWQLVEEMAEIREQSDDVRWIRQPLTGSGGLLMVDLYSA